MANLRNFVWSGLRAGSKVDVFLGRAVRIGAGEVVELEPLRLVVEGEVRLVPGKRRVEIVMPDESPRGLCTVRFGDDRHPDRPYHVDGGYLHISLPDEQKISLGGVGDRSWTWCWVESGIVRSWIGIWPAGVALPAESEPEKEPLST